MIALRFNQIALDLEKRSFSLWQEQNLLHHFCLATLHRPLPASLTRREKHHFVDDRRSSNKYYRMAVRDGDSWPIILSLGRLHTDWTRLFASEFSFHGYLGIVMALEPSNSVCQPMAVRERKSRQWTFTNGTVPSLSYGQVN
jgi:hypothetical protein